MTFRTGLSFNLFAFLKTLPLQPPPKMKKSTSQTSLKSASQDKTVTTRSAVSATLRRQTTASTVRRGAASTQTRPAAGQVSSATKRQTIASKPPTSTTRNVQSKAPASEPLSGLKGNFLNVTMCFVDVRTLNEWKKCSVHIYQVHFCKERSESLNIRRV